MDILHLTLSLFVLLLALAVFTNKARAAKHFKSTLHPNCLLTRWPLLFVTGPRSFFYFSSYWNIYTSYLAEHGYEVFNLRLPWSNPRLRQERFAEFLKSQDQAQRKFHLVVDQYTFNEFADYLREHKPHCVMSVTKVVEKHSPNDSSLKAFPVPVATLEAVPGHKSSFFVRFAYSVHQTLLAGKELPSLNVLGACKDSALQNARLLLDRSQILAEMDLRQG
ncbi:MAG: hypothetical protein ACM3MG_10575 [Bacillota bacterium]